MSDLFYRLRALVSRKAAEQELNDELRAHLEQQTAKLPSDTYLWAAVGSMALSFFLQMSGKQRTSLFVGQWAPTFLILGLYNKLVKVAGSH